jgi:hypothetical protein
VLLEKLIVSKRETDSQPGEYNWHEGIPISYCRWESIVVNGPIMAAGVVALILDSNPPNALPIVLGSHITPGVAMSVRGEREREIY